ncbi:restriction endonuclease subunit S [Mycolicibacterium phocaicum]|nr:restriction endonuclease subunit S [Mycolicibacterium phocaicum]BBZ56701.1 restriction endonuclease S [Mycolicibacterium phocaicum]
MKRYAAYVPTSEPSMPLVPKHWQVLRVKNVGKALIGLTYDPGDVVDDSDGATLVLRAGNIHEGRLHLNDNVYVAKDVPDDLRLRSGDIVICARNGSARLVGKNAVATPEVVGQTWGAFMAVLRSERNDYLRWVLNSQIFAAQTGLFSTATINQLTSGTLLNLRFAMPPLDEQCAIADFLDRETDRIDTLIEEQQQLIDLLRERRQSVITRGAIEGIDQAPLVDSGNVYLGAVPGHWTVGRFSRDVAINGGQVDPREDPWTDMVLVAPNHVKGGTGQIVERQTAREQGADSGKYVATAGQVLYSKIRPALNKVAVADEDCLTSADMYAMSSRKGDEHRYLLYYMLARPFHTFATLMSQRVKMPKINREELGEAPWLRPPLDEQRRIVAYLDEQSAKIDTLIAETERFIELSRERRAALITAAVTGQIDVRAEVA